MSEGIGEEAASRAEGVSREEFAMLQSTMEDIRSEVTGKRERETVRNMFERVKIKEPEVFQGQLDGEDSREWLFSLRLYFNAT